MCRILVTVYTIYRKSHVHMLRIELHGCIIWLYNSLMLSTQHKPLVSVLDIIVKNGDFNSKG